MNYSDKLYVWYLVGAAEWKKYVIYRGSGFEIGFGAKGIGFRGDAAWFIRAGASTIGPGANYAY